MKKYIVGVLVLLLSACFLNTLYKGLTKAQKQWYEHHYLLMEYPVPPEVSPKKPSELSYFAKLSPEHKDLYIRMFWKIREIGMEDEYKLRLKVANILFRGEGVDGEKTDRGRVLLVLGQPDYQEFRDQYGNLYNEGEERWGYARQRGNRFFQLWGYWHGVGFFQHIIWVIFEFDDAERWRYRPTNDSLEREFFQYWRWRMAPTPDGWKEWLKEVGK